MSKYVNATNPFQIEGRACWYVKVTFTDPETGRKRHLKKTTAVRVESKDSYKRALEARLKIIAQHQTGFDPSSPNRLSDFAEHYIADREAEGLANRTIEDIRKTFTAFIASRGASVFVSQITGRDVRAFLFKEQRSGFSANRHFKYLRTAFQWAVRDGQIATNPFDQIDTKALRKRMKPRPRGLLTSQDVKRIYSLLPKASFAERTYANFFLFIYGTAFRRGEACFLETKDYSFNEKVIRAVDKEEHALKTESSQGEIPMLPYAEIALIEQLKNKSQHKDERIRESRYVFCKREGEHYDPETLTCAVLTRVKKVCEQLGINSLGVDLHSLRHSLIQDLIDSGVEPITVSKFARHANLSTTLTYYHKTKDTHTKFEAIIRAADQMTLPNSTIESENLSVFVNSTLLETGVVIPESEYERDIV